MLCALVAAMLSLTACAPELSIKAYGAEGTTMSFLTGFSESAARTLRSLIGAATGVEIDEAMPIFAPQDIHKVLEAAGFTKIEAKNVSPTTFNATATYENLRIGEFVKTGALTRTANSLTLTLGPRQFWTLYALSDEETQLYLDMLMIPALSGESLTPAEYTALLASLYGVVFENEITDGALSITLSSPDGSKRTTAKISLGEILTLTKEKSWTVTW